MFHKSEKDNSMLGFIDEKGAKCGPFLFNGSKCSVVNYYDSENPAEYLRIDKFLDHENRDYKNLVTISTNVFCDQINGFIPFGKIVTLSDEWIMFESTSNELIPDLNGVLPDKRFKVKESIKLSFKDKSIVYVFDGKRIEDKFVFPNSLKDLFPLFNKTIYKPSIINNEYKSSFIDIVNSIFAPEMPTNETYPNNFVLTEQPHSPRIRSITTYNEGVEDGFCFSDIYFEEKGNEIIIEFFEDGIKLNLCVEILFNEIIISARSNTFVNTNQFGNHNIVTFNDEGLIIYDYKPKSMFDDGRKSIDISRKMKKIIKDRLS